MSGLGIHMVMEDMMNLESDDQNSVPQQGPPFQPRTLERIGYWKDLQNGTRNYLPDPRTLVDPTWRLKERVRVAKYLRRGRRCIEYCGFSYCRFECGECNMGNADLTDGTYDWPEGLAHYVEVHSVRLPSHFMAHIRPRLPWLVPWWRPAHFAKRALNYALRCLVRCVPVREDE